MAIIAYPAGLKVGMFDYELPDYTLRAISESTGSQQTRLLAPPRLALHMSSADPLSLADGAEWEVLIFQLRGGVNHLACHDIGKPAPRGTMRGTLTLNATAAAGATSLVITGGAGQASTTLLKGDWLQLGSGLTSQLVKVMADATANGSGVITVTIEPPLRIQYASSTAVTWDKPVAHFKRMGGANWGHMPGVLQKGFALNLLESWT